MRFSEVYLWWQEKRLSQVEAASLLGMSERTFRRYSRGHKACGAEGLYDARLDKIASNAASTDEVLEMLSL